MSDVTLIWETETDVQYTACNALYCVMQPLTADSGPFDLPPPATRDSEQPLCRILNLQTFYQPKGDSRRQSPDTGRGFRKIFLQLLTRERILFPRNFTKKRDSSGSFLPLVS